VIFKVVAAIEIAVALKNVESKVTDFVMNIFFVHTVVVAMNVNKPSLLMLLLSVDVAFDVTVDVAVLKDILNSIINP
jgi:hypothetical protein